MPRGRERQHHYCEDCGARLVPQRAWNAASRDERADMKYDGYAKQGIGPYCTRDTQRRTK